MTDPTWGDRRLAELIRIARKRLSHYQRSAVTRPSIAATREAQFWAGRLAFLERFAREPRLAC